MAAIANSDQARSLADSAYAILSVHKRGPDGWCEGCLDLSARLAPVPCPCARQALLTVETLGAFALDAWTVTAATVP
jgi:hypothetical protein